MSDALSPSTVDYDALEEALAAGKYDSRQSFWEGAKIKRRDRGAVKAGLFPEARAMLDDLPNSTASLIRQHVAKVSAEQVREVRRLRAEEGWSQQKIADHFGVARPTIADIIAGRTWKNV